MVPAAEPAVMPPAYLDIDAPDTVRVDTALEELEAATAANDPFGGAAASPVAAQLAVVAGGGDPDDDTYRLSGTPGSLRIEMPAKRSSPSKVIEPWPPGSV